MLLLLSLALAEDPPASTATDAPSAPVSVGGEALSPTPPVSAGGSAPPSATPVVVGEGEVPATVSTSAPPEEEEEAPFFTFGVELDSNARYLWRGLGVTSGPTLNPSVWGALDFGLEFGLWTSLHPSPADRESYPYELDPYLLYSIELGPIGLEPQVIAFVSPGSVTVDSILDITGPLVGPLGLFVRPALLLTEPMPALYTDAGLTLGAEFDNGLALEGRFGVAYALAGFNNYNFGVNQSALDTAQGNIALTWYFSDRGYVRPHVEAAYVLAEPIAKATGEPFVWSGGLAAGYDF